MTTYKVAGVQMDIAIGDKDANLNNIYLNAKTTTDAGAWLTVFPECTTTGYCFASFDEARQFAEPANGPTTQRLIEICKELNTRIVYGYLELDESGQLFNSLALVDPSGVKGAYRKVHLPTLGVDRFTTSGESGFSVIELPEMRIGLNICYDSSFPESARVLSLLGADLIVLPTNWPPTSGLTANIIPAARALENHVYYMAINRVGNERGFEFIGKSGIYSPSGATLDSAMHSNETILYAEIDPHFSRSKHLVNIPGEHEVDRINDRHPSQYRQIVQSNER